MSRQQRRLIKRSPGQRQPAIRRSSCIKVSATITAMDESTVRNPADAVNVRVSDLPPGSLLLEHKRRLPAQDRQRQSVESSKTFLVLPGPLWMHMHAAIELFAKEADAVRIYGTVPAGTYFAHQLDGDAVGSSTKYIEACGNTRCRQ